MNDSLQDGPRIWIYCVISVTMDKYVYLAISNPMQIITDEIFNSRSRQQQHIQNSAFHIDCYILGPAGVFDDMI